MDFHCYHVEDPKPASGSKSAKPFCSTIDLFWNQPEHNTRGWQGPIHESRLGMDQNPKVCQSSKQKRLETETVPNTFGPAVDIGANVCTGRTSGNWGCHPARELHHFVHAGSVHNKLWFRPPLFDPAKENSESLNDGFSRPLYPVRSCQEKSCTS
jgi:hypothetical protein